MIPVRSLILVLMLASSALAADVRVWFSPHGGCTDEAVAEIARARTSIRLQAYSFTSAPIAEALLAAKRRGVDVRLCVDRSQRTAHDTLAGYLAGKGVAVAVDARHPIAHSKTILIDGARVITGSFNFTKAAEVGNLENMLLIEDAALVKLYLANWDAHRAHSEAW